MVRTPSMMVPLGSVAPSFVLPDPSGRKVSDRDFADAPGLLVVFWCNHCPFVKHVREGFVRFAREYGERGLAIVAINSNDADTVPADAPERMAEEARIHGFPFPYLVDETQRVAKAYQAACTPDFFLFDRERRLVYRGQFDDARPGSDVEVTGADLRIAADAVLEGRIPDQRQRPALGCNIKWKPGEAPAWFGA